MTTDALGAADLQRLATWFGASFPIGAFSYSHGLESAYEAGLVTDRASLSEWIESLLLFGSARNDAILFTEAYRRFPAVDAVADLAAALNPSKELRAETLNQGAAFLKAVRHGWPDVFSSPAPTPRNPGSQCGMSGESSGLQGPVALSVAAGMCCRAAAIPLKPVLIAYLHAFAANIVSAALRCMPIGQSDGLAVQASLEPVIEQATEAALASTLDDIGSAAPMLDWLSASHETQYSRLFRS